MTQAGRSKVPVLHGPSSVIRGVPGSGTAARRREQRRLPRRSSGRRWCGGGTAVSKVRASREPPNRQPLARGAGALRRSSKRLRTRDRSPGTMPDRRTAGAPASDESSAGDCPVRWEGVDVGTAGGSAGSGAPGSGTDGAARGSDVLVVTFGESVGAEPGAEAAVGALVPYAVERGPSAWEAGTAAIGALPSPRPARVLVGRTAVTEDAGRTRLGRATRGRMGVSAPRVARSTRALDCRAS